MPFTLNSFWARWLILNQLCWRYWRYSILTSVIKIGNHRKAELFILPLTGRLTNPLLPGFKESGILGAVLRYFHRSQIWLFYLVEVLPDNHWYKPHQKPLLTAAEHQPTANWFYRRGYRHKLDKSVALPSVPCFARNRGAKYTLESQLSGLREHVDYLTKASKIPLLCWFYCCFSPPCWLCCLNASRERLWERRNWGRQWSGDVLNADTINKSLIVKI